jgi:hypothetical protein
MTVAGSDAGELRATAQQFTHAADKLDIVLLSLNGFVSTAGSWRGPDSQRFRAEWSAQSVPSIKSAVTLLRVGAETLRRNADEQEAASRADVGNSAPVVRPDAPVCYERAPDGMHGMWNEIGEISKESSGYRVQKVLGADGVQRYIVYIAGTDAAEAQTLGSNIPAISGQLDADQVAALKRLIPGGAEVMLVGYSQGGIDAQNIAASHEFTVKQIVTFGSPVRNDLNIPAIHLQYSQDIVPYLAAVNPQLYSSAASAGNGNVEVFQANPLPTSPFGLGEHMGGYGELAGKWDDEADHIEEGRAALAAQGLTKFHGDVVDVVDITAKGEGSW